MRPFCLGIVLAAAIATLATAGLSQKDPAAGPYKVIETEKVEATRASTIFPPTWRIAFWLCRGAAPWAE